jgi:hypothetical protein
MLKNNGPLMEMYRETSPAGSRCTPRDFSSDGKTANVVPAPLFRVLIYVDIED